MNLRTISTVAMATVAAVLWAGPVPASATVLTTAGGGVYTSTIKAEAVGSVVLKGVAEIKCGKSVLESTVESHGAEVRTKGKVNSLSFSECGANTVSVIKAGTLELQDTSEGNGTLTSSGAEITVLTHNVLGTVDCVYTTSNTEIGTFTGSIATLPENPTMDISGTIPRTGGSGFCGSTGTWTGSYKVTTPSVLIAISEYVGAEIKVTPSPVNWANNPEPVKSENDGDVDFGPLKIDAPVGFKPSFGCFNATLTTAGAGKSCTETVKCEVPGGGKSGLYWAFTPAPPVVIGTTFLNKC